MEIESRNGPLDRPLVVFDGNCPFCCAWIEHWKELTGDRVSYIAYQDIGERFEHLPSEDWASAIRLVLPDGEIQRGAHAVFSLLALVPGKGQMLWLYLQFPGFALLSEMFYRVVARHRSVCYRLTKVLWGIPIQNPSYHLTSRFFLRVLGGIYLIAFASFGVQAAGLIGSHGISPAADFLHAVREYAGAAGYWVVPTVFWLNASDVAIRIVWIAGLCLSGLLLVGVRWRLVRVLLFVLYLSLVAAGQEFLSFQWDALLLEAGFLAILLGSSPVVIWLYRWLLFRLMFLSGVVKLASGDTAWRLLKALPVHYQTQPLPTPLAWYVYQLPMWFQRLSVRFVFSVELVAPFLIFAPRRVRHVAGGAIATLQLLIFLTGNYAFFNLLTVALCLFLCDDKFLQRLLPRKERKPAKAPMTQSGDKAWSRATCRALAALVLFVGSFQVADAFGVHWVPADVVIRTISPFEVVNSYGLFAVMTTSRPEIVIEGSSDGNTWLPYEFKYKPGDPARRPCWVQPHQPRLDWQMWFAALGNYQTNPWIIRFMVRLLEGAPEVTALLGHNPFPDRPPRYVRATMFEYRFTTPAERQSTGEWWNREREGLYIPAISLDNSE